MQIKRLIPVSIIIVSLIITVLGIYLPWWSVRTTNEVEILLNATARADYGLLQTVSAGKRVENETESVFVLIGNLTKSEDNRNAVTSLFNTTLTLVLVGLALAGLSLVLIIISILKRPLYKFAVAASLVAAFLLLGAPIYMMSTVEALIPKFDSVMPIGIPSKWVSIRPGDITSFWGSISIPKSKAFPVWVQGGNFWLWGAALGWFLTLTAGLLLFTFAALVNYGIQEE